MEEQLEVAILAGENDENIEMLLLENIVGAENNIFQEQQFNINEMDEEQFKINFRFARGDIIRLKNALRIPANILTETGNNVDGM